MRYYEQEQPYIDRFREELPMEYAVELNQLLKIDMEGSVG